MTPVCTVDTPYPRARTGGREIFDVQQFDPNILTPFLALRFARQRLDFKGRG